MPAITPFRNEPSLGPDLWQVTVENYWDTISKNVGAAIVPSYQLGSSTIGQDGHTYVYVRASGALASGGIITVNEPAFTATPGGPGVYTAPVVAGGVPNNAYFHARRTLL